MDAFPAHPLLPIISSTMRNFRCILYKGISIDDSIALSPSSYTGDFTLEINSDMHPIGARLIPPSTYKCGLFYSEYSMISTTGNVASVCPHQILFRHPASIWANNLRFLKYDGSIGTISIANNLIYISSYSPNLGPLLAHLFLFEWDQ